MINGRFLTIQNTVTPQAMLVLSENSVHTWNLAELY
jgi:hypothetical protein